MNVTLGISTDFGRNKVTVMVEESDLLQLLTEQGAVDPAKVRAGMKQRDVFLVMNLEAQSLLALAARAWTPQGSQEDAAIVAKYKECRANRSALIDGYVKPAPGPENETPF
jgi:hypothetical protein